MTYFRPQEEHMITIIPIKLAQLNIGPTMYIDVSPKRIYLQPDKQNKRVVISEMQI